MGDLAGDPGNWYGGTSGDDTNWDDDTFPDAGDHACLNPLADPYTVSLRSSAAVDHYSIEPGATLAIGNPSGAVTLQATDDSTNAGTIRLIEATDLRTESGVAADVETLTNTGTIAVPSGGEAGLRLIGGDIDNEGTISVAHPEATFQMRGESRNPTLTNEGTLRVASSGALRMLDSVLVQNPGATIDGLGSINAAACCGPGVGGRRLVLAGGEIAPGVDVNLSGWTLESTVGSGATGNVDVVNGDSFLSGTVPPGVTIDIDAVPGRAATLLARTDATNAGTINLRGGSSFLLAENGDAADIETLTNTGTIAIPSSSEVGARHIGGNVDNEGTISVAHPEASFQRRAENRAPTLTNDGTLAVTAAFRVLDSTLVLGAGTISGPGSVDVVGGAPEAKLEVRGGEIAPNADVNVVTNADLAFVSAAAATGDIGVVSDLSEHGFSGDVPAGITIDIEDTATLRAAGAFRNDGTVVLSGRAAALRGTGIDNTGTIESPAASGGSRAVGGPLTSSGIIDLGSSVAFDDAVTTSGAFTVAADRTASSTAAFTQTAGTTTVDGILAPVTTDVDGGVLQGTGEVQGDLTNAGDVSPGPGVGTLAVTGDYTQTSAGRLSARVESPDGDRLDVTGAAALGGRLAITTGAAPGEGATFEVLGAASRSGTFATVTGASSGPYDVRYDPGGVTLVTLSTDDLPALSIDDVAVTEGDAGPARASFTVRLSAAASDPVTVDFATANRTARAPADYVPASGTVTFAPGQVERSVAVSATGDDSPEPDETIAVTLDDAEGARFEDDEGTATILNDDIALTGITPIEGGDTGSVSMTVNGGGLSAGASLRLSRAGQADIAAGDAVPAADGRSLAGVLDLRGGARGTWDVTVTLPEGRGSATLPGAFTIAETRAPDVRVQILGRTAFRGGRPFEFFLSYSNLGNIDAKGAVIGVAGIPNDVTVEMSPDLPLPPVPAELGLTASRFADTPIGKFVPIVDDVPAGGAPQLVRFTLSPPSASFEVRAMEVELPLVGSTGPASARAARSADADPALPAVDPLDQAGVAAAFEVADARLGEDNVTQRFPLPDSDPRWACVGATKDRNFAILNSSLLDGSPLRGWIIKSVTISTPLDSDGTHGAGPHTMTLIKSPHTGRSYGIDNYWRTAIVPMVESDAGGEWTADPRKEVSEYNLTGIWKPTGEEPVHWCPAPDGPPPIPIRRVGSADPNDKVGPAGVGEARFISGDPQLSYVVNFENLETATAPAQEVRITDQLDASTLDLSTFSLGPVSFGDVVLTPPAGLKDWVTEVDLRPANDLIARVEAGLDEATGVLTWRFTSLDPATGLPTDDPEAGFLPPNLDPPDGQGSVLFSVRPRGGLPTGTEIRNGASIVFDENAAIETPVWLNTIDNEAPTSQVTSVRSGTGPGCTGVELSWSATDAGAGIQDVHLYASDNDGPYGLVSVHSAQTSTTFTGRAGHAYRFYTLARDATGNLERAPAVADVVQAVQACSGGEAAPAPGFVGVVDRTAPTVKAKLTNARFRVGRVPKAKRGARKRKRVPAGTTFRVTLSEPAAFTIRIIRMTAGVRSGKKCVKPTRRTRRAGQRKRCTRLKTVGRLNTRAGKQGRNNVRFSGRIRRKALAPGRYRARITATDAAGNRSRPARLSFRVVK